MKKIWLAVSLMIVGSALHGQDFTARQHRVPRGAAPKIAVQPAVDGVVQKAVRSGNPLQMLNPLAPREYGDGRECVYYDDGDLLQNRHGHEPRPKGIRLFAFAW